MWMGGLKASEMREVEAHLKTCAACLLRVNEFRALSGLLDELPQIEPSGAFDARVRARVAAEPVKQSWWAVFAPSLRVVFAAAMLLVATVWIGSRPSDSMVGLAGDPGPGSGRERSASAGEFRCAVELRCAKRFAVVAER